MKCDWRSDPIHADAVIYIHSFGMGQKCQMYYHPNCWQSLLSSRAFDAVKIHQGEQLGCSNTSQLNSSAAKNFSTSE